MAERKVLWRCIILWLVVLCSLSGVRSSDHLAAGYCPRLQADDSWAVLLPHRLNCSAFYICSWGVPVQMVCPAGLHFNPSLQVCDWPRAAGCIVEGAEVPVDPPRPAGALLLPTSTTTRYTTTITTPLLTTSEAPTTPVDSSNSSTISAPVATDAPTGMHSTSSAISLSQSAAPTTDAEAPDRTTSSTTTSRESTKTSTANSELATEGGTDPSEHTTQAAGTVPIEDVGNPTTADPFEFFTLY